EHEQAHEVANNSTRLTADELEHIGIDFLRHDRRAGAISLRQPNEVKLRGGPENPFLGPTAEMRSDRREAKCKLEHEVTVARTIETVCENALEAKLVGHHMAVDGDTRACECRRAQ